MPNRIDLAGKTIYRLTFLRHVAGTLWDCKCVCGKFVTVNSSNVKNGHTKSCGCARSSHGMTKSTEYAVWANITGRCLRPQHPGWKDYGGRGITLYWSWQGRGGFAKFFAYVGPRPSPKHSIERIDNSRGYEPGNVKWATRNQQMRNTRANHWVEINGVRKLLKDWAHEHDIHETTVLHRIERGMTEIEAITTPARFGGRRASKKVA